jgi:hypothetical protein
MDRVFRNGDGWDCIVNGRVFGTWATKAIAKAGMEVEQRRARARADRGLTQEQWDEIVAGMRCSLADVFKTAVSDD